VLERDQAVSLPADKPGVDMVLCASCRDAPVARASCRRSVVICGGGGRDRTRSVMTPVLKSSSSGLFVQNLNARPDSSRLNLSTPRDCLARGRAFSVTERRGGFGPLPVGDVLRSIRGRLFRAQAGGSTESRDHGVTTPALTSNRS
jgi:hypothetical protein